MCASRTHEYYCVCACIGIQYTYIHAYIHIYIYIYTYVYIYIYMYIYICVYIYCSWCAPSSEGAKRRKRTSVRGGAVEGERVEGGKATSTQYNLVMQQWITYDRNDPTSSFSSFIAWVMLLRVEFLLKTDGGYPRDAGVFLSFMMANPGSSLRLNTHWSAPPVFVFSPVEVKNDFFSQIGWLCRHFCTRVGFSFLCLL